MRLGNIFKSVALIAVLSFSACSTQKGERMKLSIWDRGVKITSPTDEGTFAYLWFYEWSLFDAVQEGEHKGGDSDWTWEIDSEGTLAQSESDWFKISAEATEDGADLLLEVTNNTERDWPDIAAIIPCFNPGFDGSKNTDAVPNLKFLDDSYTNTYFLGENGLDLIAGDAPREIHFNHSQMPSIQGWDKEREDGQFIWYHKWPTSKRNAHAGLLVRESDDGTQTMAIAWDSFLTAQGHNPWKCMHLSVRLGPLKPGETKSIRGKIYLFDGSKEDCLAKFENDFPYVKIGD